MSGRRSDRSVPQWAAAEAAAERVSDGMIVGLGTGSLAVFALEALARRQRQGLRFTSIASCERTAAQARAAGIALTTFARHQRIDLTIDDADELERGTLNLTTGLDGTLLHKKIVAAASQRLVIVVDEDKLVDRLGTHAPVPVEVVEFGLEATCNALASHGASVNLRRTETGAPFITASGNRILDCRFGSISDPARLDERLRAIVGVVETGLFIGRADPVFVAGRDGVHRLDSPRAHRGGPPVLVIMGVSGSGKTTIAKILADRLGWPLKEGDDLHPTANRVKMHASIPLTDADRMPWLAAVAAWIDDQRQNKRPGIITCSALKRAYRDVLIDQRPEVRLIYLRGAHDLIAERLTHRKGHFMPADLLQSQYDALEAPGPEEDPITVDIGPSADEIADRIIRELSATQKAPLNIHAAGGGSPAGAD
jgi:ribose 5-phosphate isomerase A